MNDRPRTVQDAIADRQRWREERRKDNQDRQKDFDEKSKSGPWYGRTTAGGGGRDE